MAHYRRITPSRRIHQLLLVAADSVLLVRIAGSVRTASLAVFH